ncbi:MAG TPA: lytic transglycosylase domain-containing protein [Vicinamibacteria bacterium]|jgi:soluble lytic murein transglycosylase-like protein
MNEQREGLGNEDRVPPVSMEQRAAQRRREHGSTDRCVVERRRGDRRARASAGIVLAVASLTASALPDRAYVGARAQTLGALESPNVPAVSAEKPLTVDGLRPSLNSKFDDHIEDAAARHGVSRELVRAIIQVESGFDRLAVSAAGARGLMQLMPATARRFGVINRFDARQNIFGGTRYLRALLDHYRGDISLTAAAYNAGVTCVARYHGIPPYKQTQDYVRKVTALLSAAERAADDGDGGKG